MLFHVNLDRRPARAGAVVCVSILTITLLAIRPAQAIVVYDPTNYAQNLLTATRTLQMVKNQIKQLGNQAEMLKNWARSLDPLKATVAPELVQALDQIMQLRREARGIGLEINATREALDHLFPKDLSDATLAMLGTAARARLDAARETIGDAMLMQARIAEDLDADQALLATLLERSGQAPGGLQAAQVGNELAAFSARQTMGLAQLLASDARQESIERARALQAEEEARVKRARFLGTTNAYTRGE